jgi:hypothetical protein
MSSACIPEAFHGCTFVLTCIVREAAACDGTSQFPEGLSVNVAGVHLAKNVSSLFIILLAFICTPPVCAVNHPVKLCPSQIGSGNAPTALPCCTCLVSDAGSPPLPIKVTVLLGATFHLAKNVTLLFITVFGVTCVPPIEAVNQPANV